METRTWRALSVPLLLALSMSGCYLDQRYVYFPTPWQEGDWGRQWNLPIEDVSFQASDGVALHGWMVQAPNSPAVVLWAHGNAGNMLHRLDYLSKLHQQGVTAFLFDYRGYGRSEGQPSEKGLYDDAEAAYDVLAQRYHVPPQRLILFGQSLGTAMIGELALRRRAAGVILETPFPSVEAMAHQHYGSFPLHLLLQARYRLIDRVPKIRVPILVLHGDQDQLIPIVLGRQVFDAANEPKTWYMIPGAEHNDTYVVGGNPYFDCMLTFIRQAVASAGTTT